jgi:xylan 1,4-beta-xylosidase
MPRIVLRSKAAKFHRVPGTMRWLILTATCSAALGSADAPRAYADDPPPLREVTVDASLTVGELRPLSGVNGAPARELGRIASPNAAAAADVDGAPFYRAARIDLVRTHNEFGPGDIDAHFGGDEGLVAVSASRDALTIFPDMSADAEDPKSYNFAPTDRLVASIKAVGAQPLFRIGRSSGAAADPPEDFDKYAAIVRHVVLHYNQGWDKGFRYNVRYWELWNEPDSESSWAGSPLMYYSLYKKLALAIKSADAAALVGGPGISKPLSAGAYREEFMDFVRLGRLPLDFFSWHFYTLDANDPHIFVSIARELRTILDARGFGSTKNILDEWNADLFEGDMSKASQAAFAASALIYMLGGPIDAQTFYRGDAALRAGSAGPDEVGHALTAFGALQNTPILLRTSGGDDVGFAVVGGRSSNGRTLQVLISNYQVMPKHVRPRANAELQHLARSFDYHKNGGYDLTISMAAAGKYQVQRYRITDSINFSLVDQTRQSGQSIHLQAALPPPAVELIVVTTL